MTRPSDTSVEAHALYLEGLRRSTPEQRLAAAVAMSEEVRAPTEAGVRNHHPEFGPDEVRAAPAEILLGPELARATGLGRRASVG